MMIYRIAVVLVTAQLLCILFSELAHSEEQSKDAFYSIKAQVKELSIAPLIPRQALIEQTPLGLVKLSPNGKMLAYSVKYKRHHQIWMYDIKSKQHNRLISVKSLQDIHWTAHSDSLLYTASNALYTLTTSQANIAIKLYDFSNVNDEFLRPDPDVSDVFWVSRYIPRKRLHTLVKVHVNGAQETVYSSLYALRGFLTNNANISVVSKWVDNRITIMQKHNDEYVEIWQCDLVEPCYAHSWSPKTHELLLSTYGDHDVLTLLQLNTKTNTIKIIHQDPEQRFDIQSVEINHAGKPTIVSYTTDFANHYVIEGKNGKENQTQKAMEKINAKLDSQLLQFSLSNDQSVWLIIDSNPSSAVTKLYIYQSKTDSWQKPLEHFEKPQRYVEALAPRKPIWYVASDGMELQGYLTLPVGLDPKNVPLVVSPHGGPWNRSQGNFNSFAQLLANRGYAVFEPNFRSSTGLGKNYLMSANKDFGDGRVHKDIIDGVDHLLINGIGDPDKLAIVGHSFGGFSALTALAFVPTKFKVAFAGAAPSNLSNTILRYERNMSPAQVDRNMPRFNELMADANDPEDLDRLFQNSPDKHWQNIVNPLYLWAGENDDRVAIEDIRNMAARLQSADREVVLLSDEKECHSPSSELTREAYLYLVESALATHIGGRLEDTLSPQLKRYLLNNTDIDTADFIKQIKGSNSQMM